LYLTDSINSELSISKLFFFPKTDGIAGINGNKIEKDCSEKSTDIGEFRIRYRDERWD